MVQELAVQVQHQGQHRLVLESPLGGAARAEQSLLAEGANPVAPGGAGIRHDRQRAVSRAIPTQVVALELSVAKLVGRARAEEIGDVRQPLTTFASLGDEGKQKLAAILAIFEEIDALMKDIDARKTDTVGTAA